MATLVFVDCELVVAVILVVAFLLMVFILELVMVEVDFFDISLDVHFLLVTFVSSFSGASYVILNVVTGTLEDLLEEYMA